MDDTTDENYTDRLRTRSNAAWKRWLAVQAPYRWNLARQGLGRTLDVGCGIGRHLAHLPPGSVGVDHNYTSIREARARGLTAFTTEEWGAARHDFEPFQSVLVAHVIEHMNRNQSLEMLQFYLRDLIPGGRVFMICPQERGFASDPTHVKWTTGKDLESLAVELGLIPDRWRSFPGPRVLGHVFTHNEFTLLAHKPG